MKLHSPTFERKLRRGVKRIIRQSPELQQETRAGRRSKHHHISVLLRPICSLLLGTASYNAAEQTHHGAVGLAVITLWSLLWTSIRVQNLFTNLYRASDLPAFSLLPVEMAVVFRWQLWKLWRNSPVLLLDLIAGYIGMAAFWDERTKWLAVVPVALLSWLTLYALILFCAARLPHLPYPLFSSAVFVVGFALLIGRTFIWNALIHLLDQIGPTINLLLPTGWVSSFFLFATGQYPWTALALVLPIGALWYSVPSSLARLRENYHFGEPLYQEAPDLLPEEVQAEIEKPNSETPLRVGPTVIEEIIATRKFLSMPTWPQQGWLEKRLWNWLGAREKILAEFAFADGFALTRPWKKIFRNMAVMFLGVSVTGLANSTVQIWVLVAGMFVTGCQLLMRLADISTAFRPMSCSGVNIPFYAAYGIGFGELSWLLLKRAFVQIPFIVLFTVLGSGAVAYVIKSPMIASLLVGFKVGGLLVASRFIFLVFSFSSGTNDSSKFSLRTITLLISIVGLGGMFLLLGGAGLIIPNPIAAWSLWALALGDAYIFFRVYRTFYHFGRFDLMSLPRP